MKKIQKKIKGERAITLIALVVTIIILLILAGVAINMALGDNGLFKRSKEAVNTWKTAEEDEQSILGEIDSFLDENMNNKIDISYKKTPIMLGENIAYAVQIDFTASNLVREVELASEEFINDFKKLLQGKSEKQKEEILNNIIIANKEQIDFEPKTLEGLYDDYHLEGEHRNLTELAGKMNIPQEMMEQYGIDITDGPALIAILDLGGAPYYRIEKQSNKIYRTYNIYEIITADSRVEKVDNEFRAYENDTYNFSVKVTATGETIEVQVPVTEITAEYGTDYEYISNEDQSRCGLKDKEDKLEKFEEAYAIYNGKIYNIQDAIRSSNDDTSNYLFDYGVGSEIEKVEGVRPELGENCTLIIIKDNKLYRGNMNFISLS